MNIALNPEATADKSRETYRKTYGQFEVVTLDTAFPQAARELAETSVAQTLEAYERSKNTLEAAVDTMARSFDALGQGVAALNRKIIEIAQQNVSSSFDLAKSLATAKTLAEIVDYGRLIGASSSAHSRLKPKKSARCPRRWRPTWPRQSRRM